MQHHNLAILSCNSNDTIHLERMDGNGPQHVGDAVIDLRCLGTLRILPTSMLQAIWVCVQPTIGMVGIPQVKLLFLDKETRNKN